MRQLILFIAACGAKTVAPPPSPPSEMGRPISIEWKAEQADGDRVNVLLVIDGKPQEIGLLDAATETEPGTPATCALRAAHPLRSEFQCGAVNFYAVELHSAELVITIDDGSHAIEVKRFPVEGDGLAVRPYAL
ncbi:MAG TPA: hypothetical protein VL326_33645 [Kofleriaceae bacterium]|nr:hypothetical protein [Kofleriaceae bacterium]